MEPVTSQKAPIVLTKDEPAPLPSRDGARSDGSGRDWGAGGDRKERIGAEGDAKNATLFKHNPMMKVNVFVTKRTGSMFLVV